MTANAPHRERRRSGGSGSSSSTHRRVTTAQTRWVPVDHALGRCGLAGCGSTAAITSYAAIRSGTSPRTSPVNTGSTLEQHGVWLLGPPFDDPVRIQRPPHSSALRDRPQVHRNRISAPTVAVEVAASQDGPAIPDHGGRRATQFRERPRAVVAPCSHGSNKTAVQIPLELRLMDVPRRCQRPIRPARVPDVRRTIALRIHARSR